MAWALASETQCGTRLPADQCCPGNAIVLDAWKERQASSHESRRKLEAQVETLRRRLDQLDEVFVFRREIDRQTYERQRDRMREQMALAECDLAEETREQLDVEAVLRFAEHVLANAARLWEHATLDQKQRLQAALFPEGLTFDGSGFGTAVTCLAFAQLPVAARAEVGLASPTGFESGSPAWLASVGDSPSSRGPTRPQRLAASPPGASTACASPTA